eukprot:5712503-Alexandrium_andersonii.AAC.1
MYIAGDNRCPVCHKAFRDRQAAVVHLQRSSCQHAMVDGDVSPIPLGELRELEPKAHAHFLDLYSEA